MRKLSQYLETMSWQTRCMVCLQFLGKHAHVPVPGPVTPQSFWKWSTSITEMQIEREWGFGTECWTEKYAVIPSKGWKAMASAEKIKPREKCTMSGYRDTECGAVLDSSKVLQEPGAQGLVQVASKYHNSGISLWTFLNAAASALTCLICTFIIQHWMFTEVHSF